MGKGKSVDDDIVDDSDEPTLTHLPNMTYGESIPSRTPENYPCPISSKIFGRKRTRRFRHVWLIKEIDIDPPTTIWCTGFSNDGAYFAVGSQDALVRVFAVNTSLSIDHPSRHEWLFNDRPVSILRGHATTIVTIQWDCSKDSHRLLSTSLDKTMRLWSATDGVQLAVIQCPDWPIAAAFHPSLKNRIFTGTLDATIQVWKLRQRADDSNMTADMVEFLRVSDLLTALSVSPNGRLLVVGLRFGRVAFYDAMTLRFRCEVDCRNRRGKHSGGKKVTGLHWSADSTRLCVTTNDSRIRLIHLSDFSASLKFKGHVNERLMLQSDLSPDEQHVICASETNSVCLWDCAPPPPPPGEGRRRRGPRSRPLGRSMRPSPRPSSVPLSSQRGYSYRQSWMPGRERVIPIPSTNRGGCD
eukprot:GHVO01069438.1.p1 GENE.GHVO01069438.1~~GHVO01069438.1.p1  ORF type:complete len:423 (-),score=58.93 GHVO01069438.1:71-1306(-)